MSPVPLCLGKWGVMPPSSYGSVAPVIFGIVQHSSINLYFEDMAHQLILVKFLLGIHRSINFINWVYMFVISSTHHGRPQDFLQVWSNCGLDESPRRRKFFNSCMLLYTSFSAFLGELKLILYQCFLSIIFRFKELNDAQLGCLKLKKQPVAYWLVEQM